MLRALGRHNGPELTLTTAATLAGANPARARRMLDALVDANLVQEPIHDCFRLNTLIFTYARQLTAESEPRLS